MSQSRIVLFYYGDATDHRGRFLDDLQTQTLEGLERTHDYIQWLFPLPERSSVNPDAPSLTESDTQAFWQSEELQANLVRSLMVMLRFFGLELLQAPGSLEIRRGETFEERSRLWLTPFNHNFLRITRILRSLHLLGCSEHAAALFACLEAIHRDHHAIIGEKTFRYWKTAIR